MYPTFELATASRAQIKRGSSAFWYAVAAARQGSYAAMQQHVSVEDDLEFQQFVGDSDNIFYAVREIRPLPGGMQEYIQQELRTHKLASNVRAFYEALLTQSDPVALNEGARTVSGDYADMIRNQLKEMPEFAQLEFFTAGADGWEWAASTSPEYRGVLLTELLRKTVTELSPSAAATTVQRLVNGWRQLPWCPDLEGLLSVLRELESGGYDSILSGVELQVGWLLSRAPISSLLRLVNERVRKGSISGSDLRALVNAIVTHWDSVPPPPTAEVTRVPYMIQPISLDEDQPWHKTRAWLEDKSRKNGIWSITIMLTIGPADQEFVGQDTAASPDADRPREEEDLGELVVVLRAEGGVVTPGSAEIRLANEQQPVSTTFEITTEQDTLQLLVSIYQRQPTMLLQELKGIIDLAEGEGER
jgi:hypothetical protein